MIVVCIEADKRGGEPPAYYVVTKDPTAELLAQLRLRQMFNQELQYFFTRLDEHYSDDEVLAMLKCKAMRKEPNFARLG